MAEVRKGSVYEVEEGLVRIKPYDARETGTPLISTGSITLEVGDEVAFCLFSDGTGLVIGKMGGE